MLYAPVKHQFTSLYHSVKLYQAKKKDYKNTTLASHLQVNTYILHICICSQPGNVESKYLRKKLGIYKNRKQFSYTFC